MNAATHGPRRRRESFGIALVLALGAASAVAFSARWWWIGELAASFRWHLGWCAMLCGALLFALRMWRTACAAVILACLHVAPELQLALGARPQAASGHTLDIVEANVFWPNKRIAEVIDALRAADPDLIAFEELSPASREQLERALAAWPERVISPAPESWSEGTWGVGLFSKLPLRNARRVPIGDAYAPLIEAQVELDGRVVTVRVVHVPRPGRVQHLARRASTLAALETELAWDERCVLVGDLNTTSTSPAFDELLERTHLRDSRAGFGRQPTWTLRKLGLPLSIAIDHVLVGANVAVIERETLSLPGSDHHAVRARLALR
jgi:endonuclease/exonuclease/phosphatase (EEP) superfamily protein YafD